MIDCNSDTSEANNEDIEYQRMLLHAGLFHKLFNDEHDIQIIIPQYTSQDQKTVNFYHKGKSSKIKKQKIGNAIKKEAKPSIIIANIFKKRLRYNKPRFEK